MKKQVLTAVCGLFLAASMAAGAQVVIRIGPPQHAPEVIVASPHEGWVYQPGYQRYDGDHYVWVGGTWVEPPHSNAHWVAGHWSSHDGVWVWTEGHWR